jgi:hypothetical protein
LSVFVLLLFLSVLVVRPSSGNEALTGDQTEAQTGAQIGDSTNTVASYNVGSHSKSSEKDTHIEPAYRVVLRSLVYPGWGQLYSKKYLKALAVFTSEATLLGMIYTESREASKAYDAHLVAPDPATAERLYAEYDRHFNKRDSLIWWTAGVVLFSLADAYVDANLITFQDEFGESQKTAGISLTGGGNQDGGFVGLKCVF